MPAIFSTNMPHNICVLVQLILPFYPKIWNHSNPQIMCTFFWLAPWCEMQNDYVTFYSYWEIFDFFCPQHILVPAIHDDKTINGVMQDIPTTHTNTTIMLPYNQSWFFISAHSNYTQWIFIIFPFLTTSQYGIIFLSQHIKTTASWC